jgi:hypothetical protein
VSTFKQVVAQSSAVPRLLHPLLLTKVNSSLHLTPVVTSVKKFKAVVGEDVGEFVGAGVGGVGETVGLTETPGIGDLVGLFVGDTVGEELGAVVG